MSGRKPHFRLKAYDREEKRGSYCGVGWNNDDGSVTISLDHCVVIKRDPRIALTLWPINEKDTTDGSEENSQDPFA